MNDKENSPEGPIIRSPPFSLRNEFPPSPTRAPSAATFQRTFFSGARDGDGHRGREDDNLRKKNKEHGRSGLSELKPKDLKKMMEEAVLEGVRQSNEYIDGVEARTAERIEAIDARIDLKIEAQVEPIRVEQEQLHLRQDEQEHQHQELLEQNQQQELRIQLLEQQIQQLQQPYARAAPPGQPRRCRGYDSVNRQGVIKRRPAHDVEVGGRYIIKRSLCSTCYQAWRKAGQPRFPQH